MAESVKKMDTLRERAWDKALREYSPHATNEVNVSEKKQKPDNYSQETLTRFIQELGMPPEFLYAWQAALRDLLQPFVQKYAEWLHSQEKETFINDFKNENLPIPEALEKYPGFTEYVNADIAPLGPSK